MDILEDNMDNSLTGLGEKKDTVKKRPIRRKESLEDIINAVAEKEDVISAFKPAKPKYSTPTALPKFDKTYNETVVQTPRGIADALTELRQDLLSANVIKMADLFTHPLRYLLLKFLAGIFFGLGFVLVLTIGIWGWLHIKEVAMINTMFHKLVGLMRSLGR